MQIKQVLGVEFLQEVGVEAARLDGEMIKMPFLVALGQDILLNGLLTDQPVYVDLAGLPDAMTPVLCLKQTGKIVAVASDSLGMAGNPTADQVL